MWIQSQYKITILETFLFLPGKPYSFQTAAAHRAALYLLSFPSLVSEKNPINKKSKPSQKNIIAVSVALLLLHLKKHWIPRLFKKFTEKTSWQEIVIWLPILAVSLKGPFIKADSEGNLNCAKIRMAYKNCFYLLIFCVSIFLLHFWEVLMLDAGVWGEQAWQVWSGQDQG